jgi:guanosine-3',5'-bis(diphosphate) 3'-pyrophosphohydrolase
MDDTDSLRRVAQAFDLAARAHEDQRRGDGRKEPFISHIADVARRVAESPSLDEPTLLAALLHDVAEKTEHTLAEIEEAFGAEVAYIVAELTDDNSLPKREQKRRQVEAAPGFSDRAKRIKLADKASKLASIALASPRWWTRPKVRREVAQARKVAAGLRGVDPVLEAAFDRAAARADAALGP